MTSADRCLRARSPVVKVQQFIAVNYVARVLSQKQNCYASLDWPRGKALEQHCLQVAKKHLGASELVSPPGLTNLSQSTLKFHAIQSHAMMMLIEAAYCLQELLK